MENIFKVVQSLDENSLFKLFEHSYSRQFFNVIADAPKEVQKLLMEKILHAFNGTVREQTKVEDCYEIYRRLDSLLCSNQIKNSDFSIHNRSEAFQALILQYEEELDYHNSHQDDIDMEEIDDEDPWEQALVEVHSKTLTELEEKIQALKQDKIKTFSPEKIDELKNSDLADDLTHIADRLARLPKEEQNDLLEDFQFALEYKSQ